MTTGIRTVSCPNCERKFASNNDVFNHIKAKHRGKGITPFRPENQPEYEPSFGQRAVDAAIDRACGILNDDDWLLS